MIMIGATLLASFTAALAPQASASAVSLPVTVQTNTRLSLELEPTRFAARSFSSTPLLLVIGSESNALRSVFWLAPGATYEEVFARGTLAGLQLEVLSPSAGDWTASGALGLGDFLAQGLTQLLIEDCGHVLGNWNGGHALSVVASTGSLLPPALQSVLGNHSGGSQSQTNGGPLHPASAMHVPVPTPSDVPKEDKPPRKRQGQLPPV